MFEVTASQIELLNDTDLRSLVGLLCEQELRARGHSPAAVTAGGNQNANDGGIDVRVDLPAGVILSGFVPAAATGFQVKAQDMPRNEILEEMAPKNVLRPSIAELASKQGSYIIVSSKGSLADSALQDRKDAMRAALDGVSSTDKLTVDFYDRHRLATWVNQHPGLIPWVREKVARPLSGWRPFGDWSSSPTSLDAPYLLDDQVRLVSPSIKGDGLSAIDGVNRLRRILEEPRGAVRLVGLSGVGKTRLVQGLFDPRMGERPLAPAEAIYTDLSNSPDPVPLELVSQLTAMHYRGVLVVDNCGIELHRKLVEKVAATESLLSVITIEYDITDDEPENTDVFKLEASSVELVEKILELRFPLLPPPSRRVVAEFSDGNARVAFALAATAKNGESLANLRDTDLFKRLFEQSKRPSEGLLGAAKACALLYSFDGETLDGNDSELTTLAALAGCTANQLFGYVAELSRRQLVQRRSKWRAILPHALAHRLAKLALQDIPFSRIEEAIVNGRPQRMLRSFSKRMGYLHDDAQAQALASKWFADGGLLSQIGELNDLGSALLTNMAPVKPDATLAAIECAATRDDAFFAKDNRNRREIIYTARSIAYDPSLFARAAEVLKGFALQEGENRYESAKDALKSLFYLFLSGTHATPAQRAEFIWALLQSTNESEISLGLDLLRTMLSCGPFSSHYPFDFGARTRDFGSQPRTNKAFAAWFGEAMRVAEAIGASNSPAAGEVRKLIAGHFSELCSRAGMIDEVVVLAKNLAAGNAWSEGWIGIRSAIRKCKESAEDTDLAKLEELAEKLRPKDTPGLVRSYALSKEWSPLDIAALEEDDEDLASDTAREKVAAMCLELGRTLAEESDQLGHMLPEILQSQTEKTFVLGRGVAQACQSLTEKWQLISGLYLAIPKDTRRAGMLAGFLFGAMGRDAAETGKLLDTIAADPRFHDELVYFQGSAGLDDAAFARLLTASTLDSVPVVTFGYLAFGRSHERFTDDQISQLLRCLAGRNSGMSVAVEILGMRLFSLRSDKRPVGAALRESGRELLNQLVFEKRNGHFDHMLGDVIEASLDADHDDIARKLCSQVVEAIKAYRLNVTDVNEAIEALAKVSPIAVLDILVENANDGEETSRGIFRDLRDNRACALQAIPDHTVLGWAATNPETRYVALAQAVKYSDANDDDKALHWSTIAEKLVAAAPVPAKVLDVFLNRFPPTGGWSGSLADVLASRMSLIEALASHSRSEVRAWSAASLPKFQDYVNRERVAEASRDRGRDERFE